VQQQAGFFSASPWERLWFDDFHDSLSPFHMYSSTFSLETSYINRPVSSYKELQILKMPYLNIRPDASLSYTK
ncbi:hypothetical protein, partial [Bacillus paralicheniformis]|uniref:hypothetical protein n=1 Tax=Bacillus paralicheniformis TaxID=1648923 RepID=UPI0028526057